jgi:outer membrane protein
MKKYIVFILLFCSTFSFSNKIGVVDSDYILSKLKDYKEAEAKVNEFAKRFEEKIDQEYSKVKELEFEFQKNEFLYSKELKELKKTELINQRAKAKKTEDRYFGKTGELVRKRKELIRPIQNRLYEAIRTVANESNIIIVFDVAENYGILYSTRKIDISDDVLDMLNEE